MMIQVLQSPPYQRDSGVPIPPHITDSGVPTPSQSSDSGVPIPPNPHVIRVFQSPPVIM
ncbi:unnamed protein product [Staurois parvus]|uniref:Uncharacterized protein n=1 Tax=Staurois parvus TaxID=386267 RepID=A0ABN9ACR7_9NEOB|nr:unnamed protein product [Staurois parvus]